MEVTHVDTFIQNGLRGYTAAVCEISGPVKSSWMQDVAREMKVSETAFFYRQCTGFNLRWFSPL